MDKDNYVSLEVAQRLVDAGIVLETDMSWYFRNNEWIFRQSGSVYEGNISIPTPCFAELWRELAKYKASCYHSNGVTLAVIEGSPSFYSINPADAIAELLIRVKG